MGLGAEAAAPAPAPRVQTGGSRQTCVTRCSGRESRGSWENRGGSGLWAQHPRGHPPPGRHRYRGRGEEPLLLPKSRGDTWGPVGCCIPGAGPAVWDPAVLWGWSSCTALAASTPRDSPTGPRQPPPLSPAPQLASALPSPGCAAGGQMLLPAPRSASGPLPPGLRCPGAPGPVPAAAADVAPGTSAASGSAPRALWGGGCRGPSSGLWGELSPGPALGGGQSVPPMCCPPSCGSGTPSPVPHPYLLCNPHPR